MAPTTFKTLTNNSGTAPTLKAIKYTRGSLSILDQLGLPHRSQYIDIPSTSAAWQAIKSMIVRGAPAIAIVAVLSLAVEVTTKFQESADMSGMGTKQFADFCKERLDYLLTSRPTAVNLADAAVKLKALLDNALEEKNTTLVVLIEKLVHAAEKMLEDDVRDNHAIGKHGAEWIVKNAYVDEDGKVAVLTHCNTGSLATASYGTALGIIRSLHSSSRLSHALCTETRPYNQGSRLTAYELVYEQIPATLITDSMAATLLVSQRPRRVAAVVVGADRVVRNGDTANKIGTHTLAIVARHAGVKFVIAAPTTSIDMCTPRGEDIVIEERPAVEMVTMTGPLVNAVGDMQQTQDVDLMARVKLAAEGIGVFNPSFDVTPFELIDAIVTEKGVVEKGEDGEFRLGRLFEA